MPGKRLKIQVLRLKYEFGRSNCVIDLSCGIGLSDCADDERRAPRNRRQAKKPGRGEQRLPLGLAKTGRCVALALTTTRLAA